MPGQLAPAAVVARAGRSPFAAYRRADLPIHPPGAAISSRRWAKDPNTNVTSVEGEFDMGRALNFT